MRGMRGLARNRDTWEKIGFESKMHGGVVALMEEDEAYMLINF